MNSDSITHILENPIFKFSCNKYKIISKWYIEKKVTKTEFTKVVKYLIESGD